MDYMEKANIILEELEEFLQIDWNFKEIYIKSIIRGLRKIDKIKKELPPYQDRQFPK